MTTISEFSQLSSRQQLACLRKTAAVALKNYDLEVAGLNLLATDTNTIFRIETTDKQRYVLRISLPGQRDLIDIKSELAWLEALRRDTNVEVPEEVRPKDSSSERVVQVQLSHPTINESRYCVLFKWMDGRGVGSSDTTPPATAYKLGVVMAKLHNHADNFVPPREFTTRKLDKVWPCGVPQVVYSDAPNELFPKRRRQILLQAAERIEATLTKLYSNPGGLRFLHSDMHLGNVKTLHGELRVLDFDDSVWCFPIQDIGIAFYYLLPSEAARQGFIQGYSSLREWPASYNELGDLFVAARRLDLLSFILSEPADYADFLPGWLERTELKLREWLG